MAWGSAYESPFPYRDPDMGTGIDISHIPIKKWLITVSIWELKSS
jgi:hypothetical protein